MLPRLEPAWLRRRLVDGLLLMLLLGLSLKMSHDVWRVRDLGCEDEAAYMMVGSLIPLLGPPPADLAPLYCLWYRALLVVQPDPARLFYLNWQMLAFLLSAGAYLLCRAAGGGRAAGLLAGFLVLASGLVEVYPYPTYLAVAILAFGTALASRARSWPWALMVLALTLLLASYVRPEFAVSFVLLAVVALALAARMVARQPRQAVRLVFPVLVVLGAGGLFVRGLGNPLGGGRSFIAFGQHYALNVVTAEKLSLLPWIHFERLVARDFGEVSTIGEACRAHPRAMLWHLSVNARHLPGALRELVESKLDLPPGAWSVLVALLGGAALFGGAGLVIGQRALDRGGLAVVLVMLALLLIPTAASVLVIHPRAHYLMPVVVFSIALLVAGLGRWPRLQGAWGRLDRAPALLGLFVVLLAVLPNKAHGWNVQRLLWKRPTALPPQLCQQKTVAVLRELHVQTPCGLLDHVGIGRTFYAGLPAHCVPSWNRKERFWDFVRQNGIGIIIIDVHLAHDATLGGDPDLLLLTTRKMTGDFVLFDVPETPTFIAVRKDLLPDEVRKVASGRN